MPQVGASRGDPAGPLVGLPGHPLQQVLRLAQVPLTGYKRYGEHNRHNAQLPRNHWLLHRERAAILDYQQEHPEEGYRRLAYMMLDANVVAVSPSSVYRVLEEAGRLRKGTSAASSKGQGFAQPGAAHEHWHIDVSYLNICGTFYYLCSMATAATSSTGRSANR